MWLLLIGLMCFSVKILGGSTILAFRVNTGTIYATF